ncbi:MAG: HAD family phosphatase [Chloroflexi bacterium]|nr:HAD family phosphatase [Chloroflexota bacterium]
MTTETKAIIFDFGGVLINWNPRNLYARFFPGQPQAMEEFLREVNFMEWNAQQDKGRPFAEAVELHVKEHPQYADLIRAYHENWKESITGEIDGTVELLRALKKKGYPLYGLSNWSAETFPAIRHEFEFLNLLDDIVISGEISLIKPEPEIFEFFLEKIDMPASQCLFIDDSEANIAAAKRIGFDTVHFKSPEQLKLELKARQLL